MTLQTAAQVAGQSAGEGAIIATHHFGKELDSDFIASNAMGS